MEYQESPVPSEHGAKPRPNLQALERRLQAVEASVRALREQLDHTLAAARDGWADEAEGVPGLAMPRAAQDIARHPSAKSATSRGGDDALAQAPAQEEFSERAVEDARRFARVLVSEIELYNQSEVAQGRANKDLYVRLKPHIQRSRRAYENRFGKTAPGEADYFHEELVRSLAQNDASLLGPGGAGL
ncbi:MAG: hypothetical protein ACRD06_01905 [Terriglobia bacterium]